MKRAVLSFLIIIIGAYLLINLGRRVYDLYRTSDRMVNAEKKKALAQAENESLKKEIGYRNSEFYVEKEAREKLNLAKPEEKVAVIPGLVEPEKSVLPTPKPTPNWQKWYSLFFVNE